ncbi:MAG: formate--tetrahydrofolate ligase, partial [Clostridia bacterium]|nr:formate--tetrahydrofolate ligase [Clostridia bacterium]
TVWGEGGKGGLALAEEVVRLAEEKGDFKFSYDINASMEEKLDAICKKIYGGDGVIFTADALKDLAEIKRTGWDKLPVCVAKTQYSFSDDAALICAPTGFKITVRKLKVSSGAGFIVALTGNIMTMPGLPKVPAAENIDLTDDGKITGLF